MKARYLTLDAIRGVAAIAVFFLHGNALSAPISMNAAYRAVDLFFLLSGFVLAHAYGGRITGGIGVRSFMALRIARLYPLYLVGAAIGIAAAVLALVLRGGHMTSTEVAMGSVTLLLLLPAPSGMSGGLTPINPPAWSLLFELAINAVYAAIGRRLTTPVLVGLVVAGAIGVVASGLSCTNTDMGYGWVTLPGGFARVVFGFFTGVLLYRVRPPVPRVTALAWLVPLAAIPLMMFDSKVLWADLTCVLVLFPAMIFAGAAVQPQGERLAGLLGDTSYGLYVIHVPVILTTYKIFSYLHHDANSYAPWTGLGVLGTTLVAVVLLDRWYDRPVRAWISARLRARTASDVQPRDLDRSFVEPS